jgi:hypothetical protein
MFQSAGAQEDITPFLGRWALYLPDGAGWLEVTQEDGYIDASLLWYGGSVVPVDHVFLWGDVLIVTRSSEVVRKENDEGEAVRTHRFANWFQFSEAGYGELNGKAHFPNDNGIGVTITEFKGKLIPDLQPAPDLEKVKYGQSITLFNGKDLSGWKLINPDHENGFKVDDGALINDPVQNEGTDHIQYGNLRTVDNFEDFKLTLEVNIPENNNSGIYLRGIYEVQVLDSYQRELDSHHMGALYSRITPSVSAEKPAGEWQTFEITLCKRHVTVVLNGITIIDNQPLLGVTGGALTADEFSPGPIYLQGDHGKVMYRNIVLTPIVK